MTTKKPSHRKSAFPPSPLDHHAILAQRLDLMAGIELQHGHHGAAEHLSRQAAELREAGR